MADTLKSVDLMAEVDKLGLVFGKDYAAVYDSTMARFWFLSDGARAIIADHLATIPEGRIVAEDELAQWGCDFPRHMYGEMFFLLKPDTVISPSFMDSVQWPPCTGMRPTTWTRQLLC